MNLLQRMISGWIPSSQLPNIDNYLPWANIGGMQYPLGGLQQTLGGKVETINPGYTSLVERAYRSNPIVFACEMARMMLFTEARFQFQQMRGGRPGNYFGDRERPNSRLALLDHPWPGATTGDLLKYVLTDADFAGTSFSYLHGTGDAARITRLRPDWVTMALGSYSDPNVEAGDPEADFLGVVYYPGGPGSLREPVVILANQLAVFAPIPDPLATHRGMPWLTSVIPDIMGDQAATAHKLRYFEHGATPNLVVKVNEPDPKKFKEWTDLFTQNHSSVANAYKTIYLNPGADASVVGGNLQQIDFKVTQGAGETRIAAAAQVPPVVVGISEGLQGSSLNAGNFAASMRRFADLFARPAWRNLAGSFERIVPPPTGARLWYDDRDIPALKDDIKDAAEVRGKDSDAVYKLISAGFKADAVIEAVTAGDLGRLKGQHSGLFSVQLQAPGSTKMPLGEAPGETPVAGPGSGPEVPTQTPTKDQPTPADGKAAGREAILLEMLLRASERVDPAPIVHFTASPITVNTPENPPVTVTIERGAVEVSNPVTITTPEVLVYPADVNVNMEPTLVTVEPTPVEIYNAVSVDPTPVTVENTIEAAQVNVTVEPTPVTVENAVTVEPTPVEITNSVTVEPTPVEIHNEVMTGEVNVRAEMPASMSMQITSMPPQSMEITGLPPQKRRVTKRDPQGRIVEVIEEPE